MRPEDLANWYPRLYHMAEDGSWPLIQRLGLLSTEGLVDAFGVRGTRKERIVAARRPVSVVITSPKLGVATIRDQIPLRERALARVLQDGISPPEWYRILNSFVFFWPTEERLNTLLGARAYRARVHTILVVDTARLISSDAARVHLSPINSGSTLFNPQPRGRATFRPPEQYPYEEMRRRRGPAGAIAEVAVKGGVTPILPHLISVERRRRDEVIERLWP